MPSTRNYIVEGFDPTSIAPGGCISEAELLQMIHAAAPAADIGLIIIGETTPDAVTYTELANFGWIKKSTGELRYYNGSSWQLVATIATMADYSVAYTKLSVAGGAAYQALSVNAAVTAFEFKYVKDLIVDDTLPVSRLVKHTSDGVLLTSSGAITWTGLADTWAALFAAAVPTGSNKDLLYINSGVLAYEELNNILPNNYLKWNKIEYGTNVVTIAAGAIIIDASLSGNHSVTLTGNVTSVSIANMIAGQTLQILFVQDAVGGRTVDFTGSGLKWLGGAAPTITTDIEHGDIISVSMFGADKVATFVQDVDLS